MQRLQFCTQIQLKSTWQVESAQSVFFNQNFNIKHFRYAEALEAANHALELDSTFYKSILRRALANIELGNLKEAEKDARFLVRKEPRNMQVIRAIRRIQKPQRIGSKLQHALIRHSLKRTVARPLSENPFTHYNNMEDAFWRNILLLIQRLAVSCFLETIF